jgi:hypothetical protein
MKNHLAKYFEYRKRQRKLAHKQSNLQQITLQTVPKATVTRLESSKIKFLDKLAGYAVYCGARPFNLFQKPNMRALINALQPAYTPPNRRTIGDSLLIECYNETKTEMLKNIRQNDFINVFIDKFSTTIRERVINYYVIIKAGCFCMEQSAVKTGPSNTEK